LIVRTLMDGAYIDREPDPRQRRPGVFTGVVLLFLFLSCALGIDAETVGCAKRVVHIRITESQIAQEELQATRNMALLSEITQSEILRCARNDMSDAVMRTQAGPLPYGFGSVSALFAAAPFVAPTLPPVA
jgi:hypothetical protein